MITVMTLLALVCDWGYSNFPDSTLNWWTWIFTLLAFISAIMHLGSINEMRDYFNKIPHIFIWPFIIDLLIAVSVTFIYSVFLVSP